MASDRGVAQALEDLYSSDPSDFTKKRDALAKELKKAGDKDAAAAIAAKRKPTQIAYVLNQLARKHPDAIADLVDVGRELVREQRRAIRGETSRGLRDSIDRQRKAISEVGQKAASVMKELGVDPLAHLQEVTMALQAALIDPAVGAALEAGQLEKAPEAAVGFGGPMAVTPEAEAEPPPRPKPKPEPAPKKTAARDDDAEARAREKERERERERQRARAAHAESVAEAKAVLAAAEADARKARAAAEQAATEAEAAKLVLEKAREAAEAATKDAKRRDAELATAERTVAAAEKAVARLEANAPD